MDDKLLELKLTETIVEAIYMSSRDTLETFVKTVAGISVDDFIHLSEEEQLKILDKEVKVGTVYEMLSKYITTALNNKIKVDSALRAYETEKGKKDGTK